MTLHHVMAAALEVEMTTAQAIAEMMNAWNLIYAATQEKMPSASPEQVYQVAKSAMNSSLGVTS